MLGSKNHLAHLPRHHPMEKSVIDSALGVVGEFIYFCLGKREDSLFIQLLFGQRKPLNY